MYFFRDFNFLSYQLNVARMQADQIGRIFAYWATVYILWVVFREDFRNSTNNGATFSESRLSIFTGNGFGYILGEFIANASGHPSSMGHTCILTIRFKRLEYHIRRLTNRSVENMSIG
jgi:hypothetical protein